LRPLKLPRMEDHEIEEMIDEQRICRIAFKGGEYPYLAPFLYVVRDGSMYFHFTDYGRKMRLIEKDSRACVGVERLEKDMSKYNFVVLRGSLQVVEDPVERAEVIHKMAETAGGAFSTNFLAAHGFDKNHGWEALSPEKPMVIVKLADVTDVIGLKSPY
jgi:nitroimidazol reductase NimA-like FMN-containing flavoprotein (pyridoxamine 5'-phosphate oxidase superfamily)